MALASQSSVDFLKAYDQIPRDAYLALSEEARRRGVRVEGHVPIETGWRDTANLGVQRGFEHLHAMPTWTAKDADTLHGRWLGYHDRLQCNGGIDASHLLSS